MVLVHESRADNAVPVRSIIFSKAKQKFKKYIMFFLFTLIMKKKVSLEIKKVNYL